MREPVLGDHEGGEETHSLTASCKDPSPWAPVVAVFSVQGGSLCSFTESSSACWTGAEGGLIPYCHCPLLAHSPRTCCLPFALQTQGVWLCCFLSLVR